MFEIFNAPLTEHTPERRHEQRWRPQTKLELYICGRDLGGHPFFEQPRLIEASANGAFLEMNRLVPEGGQGLLLVNKITAEEQECKVVYVYHSDSLSVRVALAFVSSNPEFWKTPSILPLRNLSHSLA
jgi:hypothetical protein